jgi:diguanylate cyclase (GGDEF)-like protein
MLATQQIFLIASLLCFLVHLALVSAGSEAVRGMRAMRTAALLGLLGNLLYAYGRELPSFLGYEVANMAYCGAGAALAAGYRQLSGRRIHTSLLALLVGAVGLLTILFHHLFDSFTLRSAVVSLFQAGVCVDIVHSVLAGRGDQARQSHGQVHLQGPGQQNVQRFVMLMCVLVAGGHGVRMVWLLLATDPPTSLLQQSTGSLAILTVAALALPALTLGGLLTMHRHIVYQAEYIANHDHLTGAWSRKAFFEIAERETAHCKHARQPLALLLIDLDHFKAINDSAGHEAGDTALQLVATRALATLRAIDCIARLGGDEFAVLLPGADLVRASAVGKALAGALREAAAGLPAQRALTLSIGVTITLDGEPFKATLARADAALYAAKSAGRDQVIALAPPLRAQAPTLHAQMQRAG